jgi:hypothetical protein
VLLTATPAASSAALCCMPCIRGSPPQPWWCRPLPPPPLYSMLGPLACRRCSKHPQHGEQHSNKVKSSKCHSLAVGRS